MASFWLTYSRFGLPRCLFAHPSRNGWQAAILLTVCSCVAGCRSPAEDATHGAVGKEEASTQLKEWLVGLDELEQKEMHFLRRVRDRIASTGKKKNWQVTSAEIQADAEVRGRKLNTPEHAALVERARALDSEQDRPIRRLLGYERVDFEDATLSPIEKLVEGYSVLITPTPPQSKELRFIRLSDWLKERDLAIYHLKIVQTFKTTKARIKPQPPQERSIWTGPYVARELDEQIARLEEQSNQPGAPAMIKVSKAHRAPVELFANAQGRLVFGVRAQDLDGHLEHLFEIMPQLFSYFQETPDIVKKAHTDGVSPGPPSMQIDIAILYSAKG